MTFDTGIDELEGLDRLDPALRAAAGRLRVSEFGPDGIEDERAEADRAATERVMATDDTGVAIETFSVPGPSGGRLWLRTYRTAPGVVAPLVLYAHGGAFVSGNLDTDHASCVELARQTGCLVASVDYRLAPEHQHPAALDDLQCALEHALSGDLRVDRDKVAVMGRDAGAALVAMLAHRMFDGEGPEIHLQILHQPMLDSDATPSRREFRRTPGLNGLAVERCWTQYLGDAAVTGQSVPAYRANLEGLPPTHISCAEIDPCRDEAVEYANRLLHAYVHTELHVVAATFHGFDTIVPDWVVSQEVRALHAQVLNRAFGY